MALVELDGFTLVTFVMIFALIFSTYAGGSISESPFIWGAAMFFTPFMSVMDSFLNAGYGWIMPLFLVFMMMYFGFLGNFLGEGMVTLIAVASIIVVLASFGL